MAIRSSRRRSRLRSTHYATERWKPTVPLGVLLAGLILGFGFGARGRLLDQSASLQEHYLLLVSDLYAQGASLASVRDRLVGLGYSDPSVAVVSVADRLAASSDRVKQQEADQLHQFAAALAAGGERDLPTPGPERAGTSTTPPATPAILSPVAAAASPAATPIPTGTPAPTPPPSPSPSPTAATSPAPAPAVPTAVVRSSDRQPVFVRRDPNVKSPAVGIVPYGGTVQIKGVVQGQAVEPGESRWYHVGWSGKDGYIYAKYIQGGG